MAQRWDTEVACRLPAEFRPLVVFSFGSNDSTLQNGQPRIPLAASLANLRAILRTATLRCPTLLISPAPIADEDNSLRHEYVDAYGAAANQLGVPYLDVFTPLKASGIWTREASAGDGAHPSSGGYQALADLVIAWPAWQQALRPEPDATR